MTDDTLGQIQTANDNAARYCRQIEELEAWAKSVTTTISDAIGLGSEMFRRHGDQYRIDPAFVAGYIRSRREDHHNQMHRNISRIRALEAEIAALKGGEP